MNVTYNPAEVDYIIIADTPSDDLERHLRGLSTTITLINQYLNSVRTLPGGVQATDPSYIAHVETDLNDLKGLVVAISNELLKRTDEFTHEVFNRTIVTEEQQ